MSPALLQSQPGSRKPPAKGERAERFRVEIACDPPPDGATGGRNDWLMWQLADSALPAGAFAHSNGLEAACHNGAVRDSDSLAGWTEASLTQVGRGSLPFMAVCQREPHRFAEIDGACESFIVNHVANRASRAQGKAFLAAALRILRELGSDCALPAGACFHFAPVFGAVTRALEMECESAARLFLFLHLRGAVGSAIRLGIIGPLEAQSVQCRLAPHCEGLLQRCLGLDPAEAAQTAPLLEIWQGTQDRLYSRLFQS